MTKQHGAVDDALAAALQTGIPLIVRRRCKPIEQAAWVAIRFLIDTTDRTAFGSREIAQEMGTAAYPRVKDWIATLVEADLLEIVGHEAIPNLKEPRPIYRIPWKRIFEASLVEAEKAVANTNRKRLRQIASGEFFQTAMEFPVIHGSQEPVTYRSQEPVIDRSQSVIHGSQDQLPIDHRACDPWITLEGGMEGKREGVMHAHEHVLSQAPIPPPPDGEPPLAAHPLVLWRDACPDSRDLDIKIFATLASEHNATTNGHGLYWLGRAILAAALASGGDVRSANYVRAILDRWKREQAYGSDTPSYERKRQTNEGRLTRRRSVQSESQTHQPGRSATRSNGARGAAHRGEGDRSDQLDPGWRDRLLAEAEQRAREAGGD